MADEWISDAEEFCDWVEEFPSAHKSIRLQAEKLADKVTNDSRLSRVVQRLLQFVSERVPAASDSNGSG